jgi:uncharacterized protein YoxC
MQKALHRFEHLDLTALDQMAETDLKSAGRVLDHVERLDLDSLSSNANVLLLEVRRSNAKLQTFIDDTDGTVKKLQLDKLIRDADALVERADALVKQLQETMGKLEPGVTSIDFDGLNQTLAKARQAIQNMDDVLNELKQYPSGFIFGKPPPRLKEVQPISK